MAHWPKPEYISTSWLLNTPTDFMSAVLEVFDRDKFNRHDPWDAMNSEPRFRTVKLPFYKDVHMVEFQLDCSFNDGYIIASYLVAPKIGDDEKTANDSRFPNPDYEVYWLNGTSPPIHEINSKHNLVVDSIEKAMEYLEFFCAHVWGDDGGFWVCKNPEALPWLSDASGEDKKQLGDKFIAPTHLSSDEDIWKINATILYWRIPFLVTFSIQKSGMIDLLEDEPLLEKPLPVSSDKRLKGYRVIGAE